MRSVVVIGTGSLAREIVCSLAVLPVPDLHLVIVGRSRARSKELAYLAGVRSATTGQRLTVEATAMPLTSRTGYEQLTATWRPDLVMVCTSTHSPWEALDRPSAWTSFVTRAGAAATIAFQAAVVRRAAQIATPTGTRLINACLPDTVNPLLAALGTPAFCGVGNVGLIAATLLRELEPIGRRTLRVLAHHRHLGAAAPAADEARAFVDETPVADVGRLLSGQRSVPRPMLNTVTGLTAARMVAGLLTGRPLRTHVPGPAGLPGGYPVRIDEGTLSLDLPASVSRAEAIALNTRWAGQSGVTIENGRVVFGRVPGAAIGEFLPELAGGFAVEQLPHVEAVMDGLRQRLRRQPPDNPP